MELDMSQRGLQQLTDMSPSGLKKLMVLLFMLAQRTVMIVGQLIS
jgi:hypothetical protein